MPTKTVAPNNNLLHALSLAKAAQKTTHVLEIPVGTTGYGATVKNWRCDTLLKQYQFRRTSAGTPWSDQTADTLPGIAPWRAF